MQYNNPRMVANFTPEAIAAVYLDRQVTDIKDPNLGLLAPAIGDQVQVGLIPAGAVLIPELSTLHLPIFDSDAAATGAATIGLANATAAIGGPQNLYGTAKDIRGSALNFSALPGGTGLGDPEKDLPIYLTFTAAVKTLAAQGTVVLDLAFRAFRSDVDPVGTVL
jgi:hypothetical protein